MDKQKKYHWGKFKKINGEMKTVWLDEPMTKSEMEEYDDTYRHKCREIERG